MNEEDQVPAVPTRVVLPSGFPLYLADSEVVHEYAQANGDTFYYVLGQRERKAGVNTVVEPTVFKVMSTVMGKSIVETSDNLGLGTMKTTAWFDLPKIPFSLVMDMDDFFRTVARKLGTEAIVLLTYDISYRDTDDPGQGWGIIVPKQRNTAGHCNYDPVSAVDDIPDERQDEIFIVGSAHSHPNMSAFASNTDHADQADFDGLHITYGWQMTVNRGETQYHCELQMSGKQFSFKPEDVFEDLPEAPTNEKIENWIDRVDKAVTTTTTPLVAGGYDPKAGGPSRTSGTSPTSKGTDTSNGYSEYYKNLRNGVGESSWRLPPGCPSPAAAGVIVRLLANEDKCPCCKRLILEDEKRRHRCTACMIFFALPDETVEDVIKARDVAGLSAWEIIVDNETTKPIVFWHREKKESSTGTGGSYTSERVEELWAGKKDEAGKA